MTNDGVFASDLHVATTVEACRESLQQPAVHSHIGLGSEIELLNWNIKKGSRSVWQDDLRSMAVGADLVVLQEAAVEIGIETEVPHLQHSSFARGFVSASKTTGVATFSSAAPVSECRFQVVEPLLRTPKATSITAYPLAEKSENLLVVNLHAVNFTLGVARYGEQIGQVRAVIDAHDGPAILSGDFNTWNRKRLDLVNELVSDFGFSPVPMHTDDRKTFNGYPLDHVFVRGFETASGATSSVRSSDHNPMTIELQL
ncbi:MAG: endonuclease/exonuclease/phosphatase family protein [Pseudomonadota bacterium]